jgi:Tfp pilus assembly protein PilX
MPHLPKSTSVALRARQRQGGIALVVGLVILVVLALLGTAAYSVATQEERMAGNARDHARAFQAAEFALRQCENFVLTQSPFFDPNTGITPTAQGMFRAPVNGTWIGDVYLQPGIASPPSKFDKLTALTNVPTSNQPSCIAEAFESGVKLDPSKPANLITRTARVTASGYGINSTTKVTLVSFVNFFDPNY